jgi:hypothetical protein
MDIIILVSSFILSLICNYSQIIYLVEATIKAPIDPISGMCMDMAIFKNQLQVQIYLI